MPLDAEGMAKLRAMRGKGKKSMKGSSGKKSKKGKKDSEGKEKKMLVKEHMKLVKVLKEKKPTALKAELKMQTKELAKLKEKK
jgi:hypothetical protein